MGRRTQKMDWQLGSDGRTPWEASVDGERWQVRVNDFPEEKYLYSLLVDGVVAEDFQDWPRCWTRPPLAQMSEVELFVLREFRQREFEAELRKSDSTRNIALSKPLIHMRAWRALLPRRGLPDGRSPRPEIFVVDRGPSAEKVVSGLVAELYEEPWRDPRDYVLIDARGNIKEKFTVTTWSIEEELGASVFAVVGSELRNLSVSVFYSDPIRVNRVEKTVVDGLQAITADDESLGILSNALARDQQLLADETQRQDRAADARVAAIPGADDDHGVGDDFRRAQELLRSRFKAYTVEIDGAMLRALARFGTLRRSILASAGPDEAAFAVYADALDSFVIACRLVGFDRSLEKVDPDPPLAEYLEAFAALPAKIQAELRELEKTLGALEHDLLQDAEWKDWSDARLNAIQMRAAAAHVTQARERLKRALSQGEVNARA